MSRVTNLAKQKQLQEALRESEQRYQKLLESVTDCIYTVKVKRGRAKDANTSRSAIATSYSPSCVAVTGYTAAEYAADPQLWERMIYEEDREAVRQQVAKILSGETAPPLVHRLVHKDGSIRWVKNTPVVHQDKQGRIVSYQALIKDITERKKAEEALREREHFIQRVAEAMPGLLYVYDLIEQRNVYVNRRQITEILGYSPEAVQAMGATVLPTLIHSEDMPKIAAHLQQFATAKDGEVIEIEYRMRDANGEWHWIISRELVFARTADGSVQQILGTATDITHLKQVEEELRQSEERFRVALKNAPIVVFNQDTELRYTWIYNPLPGANVEDVVGKLDAELLTAEDAQRLTAIKRQVLTGGVGTRLEESLTINADVRYYDLTIEPMRDRCGEIVGITCVALDISDVHDELRLRKQAEEALQEAKQELEIKVQAQNENLIETYQFLEVERQRYQELFNFAPDAYLLTKLNGTIQEANQAAATLLRVSQQELVGKALSVFVTEGDGRQANRLRHRKTFSTQLSQLVQLQRVQDWEVQLQGRKGLPFFAAITVATVLDPNGKSVGLRWLIRDISDRKQAEETIKQQAQWERLLGTIVHHIRQSLNLDRILATTVTEVRQLLQADRVIVFRLCPDGVGRTIAEAVAPGQPTFIEEQFPDESFPEECYEFYRQGNVRIVPKIENDEFASCLIEYFVELGVKSKLVVPLLQEASVWGVLSVHYCTELPRQWQEWEIAWLKRLGDKVAIAIQQAELYQKVQTELIERKRAEKELRTNQQRQAVLLRSVPVILYTARPFDDYGATWVSENIEQLCGFSSHQLIDDPSFWASRIHPEDRERILQETSTMIGNQGEIATEYRWQCADGTYRWFLDRAVLISDEEGKPTEVIGSFVDITQLKQAEEEIRKALAQEKELNELKSRFINMASHEFRTPLSAILSSADLLEYYIQQGVAEKQLEHIQRIQTSCVNMTELLNDILMIGRAEAGKLDFQPSPLNLAELCGNLVEELQLSLDSKHKLTFVNQCHCISAGMDEKLLRHILTNLLSNAIKYSPKGGNIQLILFCQDGAAVFQIQDEGIGIPKEDQPRLFESFHRARNVATIPGTGLGLAIVKRSVDLHGGQIAIKSEVGVGTLVTVTLPLNGCSQTDEEDSGD